MAAPAMGMFASAGLGAMGTASSEQQQINVAEYNARGLRQEENQASDAAASNESSSIRSSTATLGEQAAALGQANIGTGGSAAGVEKQSATDARLNALRTWYGGELERTSLTNQANFQQWQADSIKRIEKPPSWDIGDRAADSLGPLNPAKKFLNVPSGWQVATSGQAGSAISGASMLMYPQTNYGGN